MDGFHLADVELRRRGLLGRKGAPETFDGWGYAALLARLRRPVPEDVVMAPAFERDLEQPLAGAIPVSPDCGVVVTEGNYLMLAEPAWPAVRGSLDEVWHVRSPMISAGSGWWPDMWRSASHPRPPGPGSRRSTSPTRAWWRRPPAARTGCWT